jgi:DUF4097 and DUF4098 domain-containing protein YvlB
MPRIFVHIVLGICCAPSLNAIELPTIEGVKSWLTFIKTEEVAVEYQVKPQAKVIVNNTVGTTQIEVWNLPQVKISALKQARTEDIVKETAVVTHLATQDNQSIVTIETKAPEDEKVTVDYTIYVPHGTDITIAHSIKGSVHIRAHNYQTPSPLGNVQVTTNKGSITLHADQPISRTLMLKTGKGNVELTIPTTTRARLEAHTQRGTISSSIPVTLDAITTTLSDKEWKQLSQHVRGVLGDESEGFITIDTVSGNIDITKS